MLSIGPFRASDISEIAAAFVALGWNKPAGQYQGYLEDQDAGTRTVLVARLDGAFSGYVTLNLRPDYPPFREPSIPEIQDLNVLPAFRRRRIASRLLDAAEEIAFTHSPVVGIGFALHHDYGAAQRLYVLRGYVPDALGVMSHGTRVRWGDVVKIDDDLVLYLLKTKS